MMLAVITLSPFRFTLEPVNAITSRWTTFDLVMNVVMFVPIGFIHQLSRARGTKLAWRSVLAVGIGLSALIEGAQFFAPERFPSLADLATNTAGAGVGAWLAARAIGRVDAARAVRAFGVDLPLMGLVYLLAPLLWLVGLGSEGGARAWVLLPLIASAGWIIGSVFTSFDQATRPGLLLGTGVWLTVALVPGSLGSPVLMATAGLTGLGAAWLRTVAPARLTMEAVAEGRAPRRFEVPTLRVVLPLFLSYLAVSSLTPVEPLGGAWSGTLALLPEGREPTTAVIFRTLEHIAAFTLAGYVIAEYHSRSLDRFRTVAPTVLGWAAALSCALEVARGWHPGYRASASMFVLTLIAAALGGWIYVLQLTHVRALVAPRTKGPE
jgi:VanZ family protein